MASRVGNPATQTELNKNFHNCWKKTLESKTLHEILQGKYRLGTLSNRVSGGVGVGWLKLALTLFHAFQKMKQW